MQPKTIPPLGEQNMWTLQFPVKLPISFDCIGQSKRVNLNLYIYIWWCKYIFIKLCICSHSSNDKHQMVHIWNFIRLFRNMKLIFPATILQTTMMAMMILMMKMMMLVVKIIMVLLAMMTRTFFAWLRAHIFCASSIKQWRKAQSSAREKRIIWERKKVSFG